MATDAALVRGLRRRDLVALVVNSVIGAGIFGLPSRAFALAGTYSLFAYLISAAAVVLVVLCFSEVGSRFKTTGGPYLYARAAFGPLIGFQVGWLLWIGRVTAFAALANLFVGYIEYFVPGSGAHPWRTVVLIGAISSLAVVNIVGLRVTTTVTNVLTVGKLIPLCLLVAAGLFFFDPQRYSLAAPPSYGAFSQATLLLVFAYSGFEGAAIPGGEARDPARQLPFAFLVGIGVVALVYILVQIVCIGTVPDLAASERPLSDAAGRSMGAAGASFIAAGALMSIAGTMNALMFATPRLLFGMAENRQLPRVLMATHHRFRTPIAAIVLTAALMTALAVFSTFIAAVTISTTIRLVAYAITCAALPVLRILDRQSPDTTERKAPMFVVPAGPVIAAAAVAMNLWLLSSSSRTEARLAGIAFIVGLALFAACRLPQTRSIESATGS